ncbi:MAG TPA: NifU family protein [Gemmatimonadaceae bacterium]|nr:NifU family protein [Gemmatimonadaceae bacterium]
MSVWKHGGSDDQAVEQRIRQALVELTPLLHIDAAGLELVDFEQQTGVVVLRIAGDCPDCQMSASLLREGIEAHLRMHVPEIREVRAI